MSVIDRFLRYVEFETTSNENSESIPSTEKQTVLADYLVKELKSIGVSDAYRDKYGYVYGHIPATKGFEKLPKIGLISHMDTSPDVSGKDVKAKIIKFDGTNAPMIDAKYSGEDIIVTDRTTLLGADDKAGVAEIVTALEEIISSGMPHGDIWVGFTPDEEIGCGADLFDLDYFKAAFAYTVDGDYEGEVAYENFNAASAKFSIKGVNVHPGEAKDIMVNAALVACDIQSQLPPEETPAHTEGRQGFYHLTDMKGDVAFAELSYIVRDHDKASFESRLNRLRTLEVETNQKYGTGTVSLTITDSYSNMLEIIEQHPYVVDIAKKAISMTGLTPLSRPVRGGTDGARLSFMGLPCPNLGTGGYGFHGPYEHISVEGMQTAVSVIKNIVTIVAESDL